MAISEKIKGYFEGETRDLERKIAKLDGDLDSLVREQRFTRFAAQTAVAFEVFKEVAPMVTGVFRALTNAAIEASPHVAGIRNEQYRLNQEFDRTKAILGERLIGNVDTLGLKMAGLRGYVSDLNQQMDTFAESPGGRLFVHLATGGMMAASPLAMGLGLLGKAGVFRRASAALDARGMQDAFVGPMPPDGFRPSASGGSGTPSRPTIANAALIEEGGGFDALGKMVRGGRLRMEVLGVGEAIETTAYSMSRAELASAQWSVTMDGAMQMATSSLRAHLQEQLRFENLKKASGKRILQSVLADVGSQALAEAAFQAAMAVGYAWINPAQAAKHAQAAIMLGAVAGSAALGYAAAGGSFEQGGGPSGPVDASGRDRVGGGSASSRSVAAAAAPGVINFTLTFIYNGPAYYVGPGGMEEFVGSLVPLINERIDTGELKAVAA